MVRRNILLAIVMILAWPVLAADIPVTGGNGSVSLEDLAGSNVLVTIKLKGRQVTDPNLRILEVYDTNLRAVTQDDVFISHLFEHIESIEIQSGEVEKKTFEVPKMEGLTGDDQRALEEAIAHTAKIYPASNNNQPVKMRAASILAMNGEEEALGQLKQWTTTNDLRTQLEAATELYLIGETVPEEIIRRGLGSGNRKLRAMGALLAGYAGFNDVALQRMLNDRAAELAGPAARSLARLGDRGIVPKLLEMLDAASEQKNEAAIFALSTLGGEDIAKQMNYLIEQSGTSEGYRYRLMRVLYNIGDPMGQRYLLQTLGESPTLAPEAALLLAKREEWKAMEYLHARLDRREDPTQCNLQYRVRNAAALLEGGDVAATSVLQALIREDDAGVLKAVCRAAVEAGDRRLVAVIRPTFQNKNMEVAVNGALSVMAMARPELRDRLLQIWHDHDHADPCFGVLKATAQR